MTKDERRLALGPLKERTITFTEENFDTLKAIQREMEAKEQRRITNSEALAELIRRATAGH